MPTARISTRKATAPNKPDSPNNIYPIQARALPRATKETRLHQRARVIWLYGLSGSGKSTLALALERHLHAAGFATTLLDGDNLRSGLNRDLGFSEVDRAENIRRAAETAKLFVESGLIVIASFITPLRAYRELARNIVGKSDFIEVFVKASFETCASRDPKGLYAKSSAGQISNFTGTTGARFEPPTADDVVLTIDTENTAPELALSRLHAAVLPRIQYQQ